MLNRVKRRLVIYNAAVLVVVFLFFFGGTWLLMKSGFTMQSNRVLGQLALAGLSEFPNPGTSGPIMPEILDDNTRFPAPPQQGWQDMRDERAAFHYNATGELLRITSDRTMADDLRTELQRRAQSLPSTETHGTYHASTGWYRYFARPDTNGGRVVAFVDINREKAVFSSLLQVYLVIGVAGLVLILMSSLFLTNRALIPIRQAWERQVRFVGDASHELRTPLTVISTNLDVIAENREESVESQMHWLANVRRAYRRMDSLVSDLLFLAQVDAGRPMTEQRPFSLSKAAAETAQQFEATALRRGMTLKQDIPDEIQLTGDDMRIRQLIAILLDNAFKYTQDKGTVSIQASADPHAVFLRISDTGIGIPQVDRKRIFERFYRVDKARTRENGGNGMGLSIASCIVREHGGSISVESEAGIGSNFTVTLPVRKPGWFFWSKQAFSKRISGKPHQKG